MRGIICKALAGFYYVLCADVVYECRARGIFRKDGIRPLVGDEVDILEVAGPFMQPSASSPEMGVGSVDAVCPRLNSFERPPIANVDLIVLVASVRRPKPSLLMLDRVALAAEHKDAQIMICINKTDLAKPGELEALAEHYKNAYLTRFICAKDGQGIEALKNDLRGKRAALTGPSGAGKSTLINLLLGEHASVTGEISAKLQRGRNTTRHCELFRGDGFYLFDTPGYTSFENQGIDSAALAGYFPDFAPYMGRCRFDDCRHMSEPECAVREAAEKGLIQADRYSSYKEIYASLLEAEANRY